MGYLHTMEQTYVPPVWTPERRAAFLENLAMCGNVQDAAISVGMTRQSAYKLRARDAAFADAWELARLAALEVAVDTLHCRAVEGYLEEVWHAGQCVGTRQVYDNKLLLAHIARLDARRKQRYHDVARLPDIIDALAAAEDAGAAPIACHDHDDDALTEDMAAELARLREADPEFTGELAMLDALASALHGEAAHEPLSDGLDPAGPSASLNRRARRAADARRRR
jgi:hypothetical protein